MNKLCATHFASLEVYARSAACLLEMIRQYISSHHGCMFDTMCIAINFDNFLCKREKREEKEKETDKRERDSQR